MRFLLDVNAGGSLVSWLEDLGHDVVEVRHKDPGMKDDDILDWAVKEKRIIITTDSDFEEIIWRQRKVHCGILRLENIPRLERKTLLFDTLDKHGGDLDSGAIVIASKIKFRVRKP
jgi:predicted nuclease of predicted toxin-antitoxin system